MEAMYGAEREHAAVEDQQHIANRDLDELADVADRARLVREEAERRETVAHRAVAEAGRVVELLNNEARRLSQEVDNAQQAFEAAHLAELAAKVEWERAGGGGPNEKDPGHGPDTTSAEGTGPGVFNSPADDAQRQEDQDREARLAESIRKMQEMAREEELQRSIRRMAALAEEEKRGKKEEDLRRKQEAEEAEERAKREEYERMKREKQERLEQEARERRGREARERREREAREARERQEREAHEREEREKLEALRRLEALKEATEKERARCHQRDQTLLGFSLFWSNHRALERFKAVSLEFESISFSDTQPFTFESVPWPVLHWPHSLKVDDVEWSAVEEFFQAAQSFLPLDEYKDLVEKSHRRFHPDKWRSRRLLQTVYDDTLRTQIERAGNVVSQALTPIWLASRKLC
jgi:hypothetical protein